MLKSTQFHETEVRYEKLKEVLNNCKRLAVLIHDNPDPDGIASAVALVHLVKRAMAIPGAVIYNGVIGRAENRAMVKELHLPMIHLSEVNWRLYDMIALVDHQPNRDSKRHPDAMIPSIVIDHHPLVYRSMKIQFMDVRKSFGSNSSMLTQYLRAASCPIPKYLASALIYGICSDTQNFSRGFSPDDLDAYLHLFPLANNLKLERILHPLVEPAYLRALLMGFQRAMIYKDVAVTYTGAVTVPDLSADVADRLINIKGIKSALAIGFYDGVLFLSVRTRAARKDAGWLIRKTVAKKGLAGGHGFMAGAQICIGFDRGMAEETSHALMLKFIRLIHSNCKARMNPQPLLPRLPTHSL
jgi:nanoRNase/pAp phosphatase (c-di-AMP/oligoRNAs hydrolase)